MVVASCGGSSGNVKKNPDPDVPDISNPQIPAFNAHLTLTKATVAQRQGFTGANIRIGILDTGVNSNHPALAGRVAANLNYVSSQYNNLSVGDANGHGTTVAQLAAGQAVGLWPGGIAPGATIVSARIINDTPPNDDGSGQGNPIGNGGLGLSQVHDAMISYGVKILNNSWGGVYWSDAATTEAVASEYRRFVNDYSGLVVFAAGNESLPNPSDTAMLPSKLLPNGSTSTDLERGWITVAAVDTENPTRLASYSNACGESMNYCLVAPGTVTFTRFDDRIGGKTNYMYGSGTSFAAPLVSGAAALVWQAFPYFDNDLVRQTLLGTATDLGAPGVDPVFGYGLLNVEAAVRGPAKFNWGDVIADVYVASSTWSNDISGSGGLIKRGGGTLTLTGNNTYTGGTEVVAGVLRSTRSLSSNVLVGANATLAGQGQIIGSVSNNGGTLEVGNGGLYLQGNYSQTSNASLALQVGDILSVGGAAELNNGTLHILGKRDYVSTGREYDVLQAAGGVVGRFNDTITQGPGVFLSARPITYNANNVVVIFDRLDVIRTTGGMGAIDTASMESAVRVENAFRKLDQVQAGTGTHVVSDGFFRAAGAFQEMATTDAAKSSLRSLSGELHAMASSMTFDAIDMQRRALSSRFDTLNMSERILPGTWATRLGEAGRGGYMGNDFSVSGWMMGNDHRVGDAGIAGFAFSEARADNHRSRQFGRSRDRQAQGQAYFGTLRGDAYTLGQVGFGRYDRDMSRYLQLRESSAGVHANYAGDFISASFESGYRFSFQDAGITPYLGADYARVASAGFNESGADGFGLRANGSISERFQATAGVRGEKNWSGATWRAYAEWQQTVSSSGLSIDASFVGIDAWSSLSGLQPSRSGGLFGISVDSWLSRNARLSFGYDQRFGPRGEARMVSATLRTGF
jgi:autotransporter-associated beta strand protein